MSRSGALEDSHDKRPVLVVTAGPSRAGRSIPSAEPDLPTYSYKDSGASIIYATTSREADDAAQLLLGSDALGYDIEYKPTFIAGAPENRTALIQLGNESVVLLCQVSAIRHVPQSIIDLLQDPSVKKLGAGISGDRKKLNRDFGIILQGDTDLGHHAREVDPDSWRGIKGNDGLAKLTAKYLNKKLIKNKKVSMSDWSRRLTPIQIDYAANDCLCALEIYRVLEGMRSSDTSQAKPRVQRSEIQIQGIASSSRSLLSRIGPVRVRERPPKEGRSRFQAQAS